MTLTGQAQTANQFNSWWTYSGNHKVGAKTSVHTLYSFRRNGPISEWQQSLLRIGFNIKVGDNLTVTPNYDWVVTFPYGEQPIREKFTEHRLTAQASQTSSVGKVSIKHRYRVEQRFIGNHEVSSRQRFRYRLTSKVPLQGTKRRARNLFLVCYNELFVNFGNEVGNHVFDQNWFYAGLNYTSASGYGFGLGYMNQYLVKSDNTHRENNHTLQFSFTKSLDFTGDSIQSNQ